MVAYENLSLREEVENLKAELLAKYGHLPMEVKLYKENDVERMYEYGKAYQEFSFQRFVMRRSKRPHKKLVEQCEIMEEFLFGIHWIAYNRLF